MTYYIMATRMDFPKSTANRINKRIKEIDDTACFLGPLDIPGNDIAGWLERPNDGTNDHPDTRERNKRMAAIANEELGIED